MLNQILNKRYFRDTFGKDPTKDATQYMRKERLKQIGIYHKNISEGRGKGKSDIDDITWNDLDMDDVFFRINNTKSFIGEQLLYHRLHSTDEMNTNFGPDEDIYFDKWKSYEKKVEFLTLNQVQRYKIENELRNIGKKNTAYYMIQLMSYFEPYSQLQTIIFRILQMIFVISLVG